ncbi:hypothetical protein HYFRA_00010819 [Hymenoscyphus fraxineus]|uniref:RNase H type-1 domain-containing protein n=1 Tax=Hymenoscyphus fraxineus TaxID=746836 RepID=A0A9N9L392_9HELO|nr:hypothetical protein HYFRA_00010819 [Hymenoscyphus fraxineus]
MRFTPYNPSPYSSKTTTHALRTPTITDKDAHSQLHPPKKKVPPKHRFEKCALFVPPKNTMGPGCIFAPAQPEGVPGPRFVRGGKQVLVFAAGFCGEKRGGDGEVEGGNGGGAGCAFTFRPPGWSRKGVFHDGTVGFRLESRGPPTPALRGSVVDVHTNERAELRAVIAALQFRRWDVEGWESVVVAVDSEYVVGGATEMVWRWREKKWRTVRKKVVLNRDLWEVLIQVVERMGRDGVEVLFWKIRKEDNVACGGARDASLLKEVDGEFTEYRGIEM